MSKINIVSLLLLVVGIGIDGYCNGLSLASLIFALLIGILCVRFYMTRHDERLFKTLAHTTKEYALGRFDSRITHIKGSGAVVEICEHLNDFADHLEAFLREMKSSIESSQEGRYYRKGLAGGLNGTLAQNIEGINRALSAIEENAKDSIRNALSKNLMSLSLKSQNANLDNIANTLNKDIISMKKVDLNIRDIRNASVESRKDISTLTESVSELLSLIERNNQSIQSLAEKSRDIGSIVALIDNIANQTNLLALNAAIEAARAGEHGRGFAVVADEVRKLAENTQKATNEISISIQSMQQEVGSIEEGGDEVSKIASVSESKLHTFNEVFDKMEANSVSLDEIFAQLYKQLVLSVTKLDHILFKSNLYLCLNTQEKNENLVSLNPISRLLENEDTQSVIHTLLPQSRADEIAQRLVTDSAKATSFIGEEITQGNSTEIIQSVSDLEQTSNSLLESLSKH
ncbi:methyl-accepting chemotaxis protein [Helicobacter cinaedi]|uniref:methyl-accepting chemotaxis protein n=1 Tax=Helicobacter cinaedi TaxID=213 RepID=UPI000CF14F9C|nr:methyl-accepting chemotaxis protein [Helicobacter cinaedi]